MGTTRDSPLVLEMINHKQSVEEHLREMERQEDLEMVRHARRVARSILKDIAIMDESYGEGTAEAFFNPTVIRTRAAARGVQEHLLYIVEKVVAEGRNHD